MAGNVVFFQALSQDGFVTDNQGSAAWQVPFFTAELSFHAFISGVSAVIIAAASYDKIVAGGTWPYGSIPGIVPSDDPIVDIGAAVSAAPQDPAALIAAARAKGVGTIWLQGDTPLALRLMEGGWIDRVDLFILPSVLGAGTEHLDRTNLPGFELSDEQEFSNGVRRASYRKKADASD